MMQSASIHKYQRPSFLVTKTASFNVRGKESRVIPAILDARVDLVVVMVMECPQRWLKVAKCAVVSRLTFR